MNDPQRPHFDIFAGENGEHYWHLRAANGEIVAASGEGFTRREDAERSVVAAARAFQQAIAQAPELVRES